MNHSTILKISNLDFSYGSKNIFKSFSLDVKAGSFFHLKGENGAGKSTLLKVIAGLLQPQKGWVEFYSAENSSAGSLDARTCFAFLDAEYNGLFLDRPSLWNLKFYKSLNHSSSDTDKTSLANISTKWGLNPKLLKDINVSKFSTGMKRRLALACLEVQSKKIWILDEPFNGLDQQGTKLLAEAFKMHLDHGGGILLSSHIDSFFSSLNPTTIWMGSHSSQKIVSN